MDQMHQDTNKMLAEIMANMHSLKTSAEGEQSTTQDRDTNQLKQPHLVQSHSVHGIGTSHQTQHEVVHLRQDQEARFE